jgi:hypothetical protein
MWRDCHICHFQQLYVNIDPVKHATQSTHLFIVTIISDNLLTLGELIYWLTVDYFGRFAILKNIYIYILISGKCSSMLNSCSLYWHLFSIQDVYAMLA